MVDAADQGVAEEEAVDSVEDAAAVAEDADSKRAEARGSWKIPGDFSNVERILSGYRWRICESGLGLWTLALSMA